MDDGWLAPCLTSHSIVFIRNDGHGDGGRLVVGAEEHQICPFYPTTLAILPHLGLLVVRDAVSMCLEVFATADTISMWSMSDIRLAWIRAVVQTSALCVNRKVVT